MSIRRIRRKYPAGLQGAYVDRKFFLRKIQEFEEENTPSGFQLAAVYKTRLLELEKNIAIMEAEVQEINKEEAEFRKARGCR